MQITGKSRIRPLKFEQWKVGDQTFADTDKLLEQVDKLPTINRDVEYSYRERGPSLGKKFSDGLSLGMKSVGVVGLIVAAASVGFAIAVPESQPVNAMEAACMLASPVVLGFPFGFINGFGLSTPKQGKLTGDLIVEKCNKKRTTLLIDGY